MIVLAWVTLIFYVLASGWFILCLLRPGRTLTVGARIVYLGCLAVHLAFVVALGLKDQSLPLSSPWQFINMTILMASAMLLPFVLKHSTLVMGAFYLPAATIALNFSLHQESLYIQPLMGASRYLYPLHTLSVTIGEALFAVAAITSVIYLIHERIIKKGSIHGPGASLPPLSILDRILYACLGLGFVALTTGMILGGFWAVKADLLAGPLIPKITAAGITWLAFAVSLHQRFAIGWQGRRTAVITLVGFILMIILAIGTHLAFPNTHGLGLLQ